MAGDVVTAEQLEKMTPDERHRLLDERVVTDLSRVPPEFLARVRAKARALFDRKAQHLPKT